MLTKNERFSNIARIRVKELYKDTVSDLKLDERSDGLYVGAYNVGNVRAKEWKSRGEPLVVELIHEMFKKYGGSLDELADEGRMLIREASGIMSELINELNYVAQAKFLPLTGICKYLR